MNVLVLHGPNLDLLGRRPGDDPALTLPVLDRRIAERARQLGIAIRSMQSNHEGALVDALHNPGDWAEAVLLSPGLLALTSHVLREAVACTRMPVVEVHLHDASGKASVRRHSLLQDVCAARVVGEGPDGYLRALERLVAGASKARPPAARKTLGSGEKRGLERRPPPTTPAAPARAVKTLERRPQPAPVAPASAPGPRPVAKTLGRRSGPATATAPSAAAAGRSGEGGALTRARVRARIADRLGGRLTPAGLSTWARAQWLELQRGAPVESGQRELLEDTLQQLLLGMLKPSLLGDQQLVELMTALDG